MKAMIFINQAASAWKAPGKLVECMDRVLDAFGGPPLSLVCESRDWNECLRDAFAGGCRTFIAAGGDGTVNRVANLLLDLPENIRRDVCLGAIGLGSSNDFHKPFHGVSNGAVPLCLGTENARSRNVIRADFTDASGKTAGTHILVSCSMGIVAKGCHVFNNSRSAGMIKRISSGWAIKISALRALCVQGAIPVHVRIDENEGDDYVLSNLSIVLSANIAGKMKFKTQVNPYGDTFAVKAYPDMGIRRRLRAFRELQSENAPSIAGELDWSATCCEIIPAFPSIVEIDGDTVTVERIRLELVREALRVCSPTG